jgi:hypothetical protein
MRKRNVKLSTLGNQTLFANLRFVHPFLNRTFRTLTEEDTKSEEVFQELFPGEVIDFPKLTAIYKYQKCDIKTKTT